MDKWILRQTVNLAKEPDLYSGGAALMLPGDADAHVWQITVMNGDMPADMTGASATGYFARTDGNAVPVDGKIEGNIVSVTLKKECYAYSGALRGIVRLNMSNATMTLCTGLFMVGDKIGDGLVEPGNVFPDLDTLFNIVRGLEERHEADTVQTREDINALNRKTAANAAAIAQITGGATVDPNAEILDVRVAYDGTTYTSAGLAVRSQVEDAIKAAERDEIEELSNGHIRRIHFDQDSTMETYKISEGVPAVSGLPKPASKYIKCPRTLLISYSDDSARCYLNFYEMTENGYAIVWDVLKKSTGTGVLNYLNNDGSMSMIEIPDGRYMRIGIDAGNIEFYEWDGKAFGPSLSSDTVFVTASMDANTGKYSVSTGSMNASGTGGITIPGSARAVVCHNGGAIGQIIGVNGTEKTVFGGKAFKRFWKMPAGYEYFKARFSNECTFDQMSNATGNASKKTYTGDADRYISVACESECSCRAAARAEKIVDIARKINAIEWKALNDIKVNGHDHTFKAGVAYNGVPYRSQWEHPRYIGWHVSLRTWLSALADEKSVFYSTNAIESYYSLVCSAFAQLCCGWPYPETNIGMLYDPDVDMVCGSMPQLGAVWSDAYDRTLTGFHCVVPELVEKTGDAIAVTVHESTRPLSMRTTRYSNISSTNSVNARYQESTGDDYYDSYGVAAYHKRAVKKPWQPPTPWFDLDDKTVLECSARPHRGDRSVYAEAERSIVINIDAGAQKLYLKKEGGTAESFDLDGETSMDVYMRAENGGPGIYCVWTDLDGISEADANAENCQSFEYVDPEPITCTMTETSMQFSRNDFWYCLIKFKGSPNYDNQKILQASSVCARSDGDYGAWFKNGAKIADREVIAMYAKGKYGAYLVPVDVQ